MARFRRVYRLVVGPAGGQGIVVEAPIHIEFDVEKDGEEEPNVHTFRLFNLAEATRAAMERPDMRAYLYAGYEEEGGAILMAGGTVVDSFTSFEAPDVITELAVADGYAEIRDSAVSLSYGAGASSEAIVADVARQMGLVLNMPQSLPPRTWQHGFSFYGPARAALHKLCRGAGMEWSVQNEALQVVATNGVTERSVVVLNAASGLLGSPERVREGSRETDAGGKKGKPSKKQRRDGWRVRSLLLPWVNPGDRVQMDGRHVKGLWRVLSVKHQGQYQGGDWSTELHLVEV